MSRNTVIWNAAMLKSAKAKILLGNGVVVMNEKHKYFGKVFFFKSFFTLIKILNNCLICHLFCSSYFGLSIKSISRLFTIAVQILLILLKIGQLHDNGVDSSVSQPWFVLVLLFSLTFIQNILRVSLSFTCAKPSFTCIISLHIMFITCRGEIFKIDSFLTFIYFISYF